MKSLAWKALVPVVAVIAFMLPACSPPSFKPSVTPTVEKKAEVKAAEIARPEPPQPEPKPEAAKPLPQVDLAKLPEIGYRMTRHNGWVYLLASYRKEGNLYFVVEVTGKKSSHPVEAVKAFETLAHDQLVLAATDYKSPSAPSRPIEQKKESTWGPLGKNPRSVSKAKAEDAASEIPAFEFPVNPQPFVTPRSSSPATSLCGATTLKGAPCQRKVKNGGYCYQHR